MNFVQNVWSDELPRRGWRISAKTWRTGTLGEAKMSLLIKGTVWVETAGQ